MTLAAVCQQLASYRYRVGNEAELQQQIETALTREGITFTPQYVLDAQTRLDVFLPDYAAAVELKTEGSPASVLRQLHRYAQLTPIAALVLVTTRARLCGMPDVLNHKPLHVVALWEGSL